MKYFTRTEYDLLFDHDGEIEEEYHRPRKASQSLLQYALVMAIAIAAFLVGRLSVIQSKFLMDIRSASNDFCESIFVHRIENGANLLKHRSQRH